MSGLVGRLLGRYEVVSLLGVGGMGEVYRARDTELERDVALKVLPEAAAEDPARLERFPREARAVARLSHPNILEIHDVGCDDGVHYAVAELLEGENLRERLKRGRLPVRKSVAIADAISRGLGAAHSQGVVHRDVKPENVLLTSDGRVKVLDFGIASLHEPEALVAGPGASEVSTITAAGSLLGTIGYMAPEQVRGEAADARSDVFALGCVLYEMLTGQRAFHRTTPAETLAAVLHDEPPPPTTLTPDIPAGIDRVVMRCLEKEPGERFQSAADVAFALRAAEGSRGHRPAARRRKLDRRLVASAILGAAVVVAAGLTWRYVTLTPPIPLAAQHLAVMQFESVSDDVRDRAFAAGFTEALADALNVVEEESLGELWVLPRETAKTRDPAEFPRLAKRFALGAGITGRVESLNGKFRVRFERLDPQGGSPTEVTTIEDGLGNLSNIQVQPIVTTASLVGVETSDPVRASLEKASTNVWPAYEEYLVGRGMLEVDPSRTGLESAIAHLDRAVRLDPTFVGARLAQSRAQLALFRKSQDQTALSEAVRHAGYAASNGPRPGDGYRALAEIASARGDFDGALESLRFAAQHSPRSGETSLLLARALARAGLEPEAERAYQRAIYLRPGYWPAHHWLARFYLDRGQYESAAAEFRQVIECAPECSAGYTNVGRTYELLGRRAGALAMFERSLEVDPEGNYVALSNLGAMYFDDSRFADAIDMLERARKINEGTTWSGETLAGPMRRRAQAPNAPQSASGSAVELAEERRKEDPGDVRLLCRQAGYYAALGENDRGKEVLEQAIAKKPEDPEILIKVAETWEDLGERELALEWAEKAFAAGASPGRFATRPSLRALMSDPRFRALAGDRARTQPEPTERRSEDED